MAITNQLNSATTPPSINKGGSGLNTFTTAYAPVAAGTTATGNLQVCSTGLSTTGAILTSNGSSSLPSFQLPNPRVLVSTTTLTTTNIRNMFGTPVQILAAQGANTLIVPHATVVQYVYGGSTFSGGSGDGFGPLIAYSNSVGNYFYVSFLDIATYNFNMVSYGSIGNNPNGFTYSSVVGTPSQFINKGIIVSNATAAYTGGNGSLIITLFYSVLTTSV